MKEKKSIVCFGELVVDCFGSIADGFIPKFGGAPGNTAIGLTKLEQKNVAFIGKVGDEFFGDFLANTLEANGVNTNHLIKSIKDKTTLAFVSLGNDGERDFSFYSGAHDQITSSDIIPVDLSEARVLQFGSLTQSNEMCAEATNRMLEKAKEESVYIAYDPNVREALWEDIEMLKRTILETIPQVDMLKINRGEMELLSGGEKDVEKAAASLWQDNLQLLLVTLGAEGAYWKTKEAEGRVPTSKIRPVDTTGAGDAFNAGVLHKLFDHIENGKLKKEEVDLNSVVHFANKVASLSTLNKGAIESLPSLEEVQKIL